MSQYAGNIIKPLCLWGHYKPLRVCLKKVYKFPHLIISVINYDNNEQFHWFFSWWHCLHMDIQSVAIKTQDCQRAKISDNPLILCQRMELLILSTDKMSPITSVAQWRVPGSWVCRVRRTTSHSERFFRHSHVIALRKHKMRCSAIQRRMTPGC